MVKVMFYTLLLLGISAGVYLHGETHMNKDLFISLHFFLEFFSVIVSYAIALQCWFTFQHSHSSRRILIGALFLFVGSVDLFHTLIYQGMPFFLLENSVQKAIWYWMSARLAEAVIFAYTIIRTDSFARQFMKFDYLLSVCCTLAVLSIVSFFPQYLPSLYEAGSGTTGTKALLEYIVILFQCYTMGVLYYRQRIYKIAFDKNIMIALALMSLSGFILSIYHDLYTWDSILSHVFKGVGYFFLLKALYVQSVDEPYQREKKAQELLSQAEIELNHFFNLSLDLLIMLDKEGRFRYVNPFVTDCLGYSDQELILKPISEFIHPHDLAESSSQFKRILLKRTTLKLFENRFKHRNGQYCWLEWSAVYDKKRKLIYAVARDISKRKHLEANLRENEERFRNAFDHANIGMAIVALDGKWVEVNQMFTQMLGYTEGDLVGKNCTKMTYAEDQPIEQSYTKRLIQGDIAYFELEKRYHHKLGQVLWAQVNKSMVRDIKGRPLYILAKIQDMTELKETQEKLLFLAALVESADTAIIGHDRMGCITHWNRAAQQIFGYTAGEALGKSMDLLIPTERKLDLYDVIQKIQRNEKVTDYETRYLKKDGTSIQVSLTASPVIGADGKVLGFSTIARDVTQRSLLEREIARFDRLNLVGEMAASISHEVRNPMTTVRGYLQMLGHKQDFQKYREQFRIMIDELDRANTIITEFLSIGRNKTVNMEVQALNDVIQALAPLIQADALAQDKSVVIHLGQTPAFNMNDREIRQVILNLTRNGLEAMSPKKTLTIQTWRESEEVILAVTDEGTGISNEVLEKIGTPFFTTKENGTGLGLGVCYSIAERHQAKIDIKTGPAGTTFLVRFQVKSEQDAGVVVH